MTKIKLVEDAYYEGCERRLMTANGETSTNTVNAHYEAKAVDDNGNEYMVVWSIDEDYDPSSMEEDMACDWDNPVYVECDYKDVTNNVEVM